MLDQTTVENRLKTLDLYWSDAEKQERHQAAQEDLSK